MVNSMNIARICAAFAQAAQADIGISPMIVTSDHEMTDEVRKTSQTYGYNFEDIDCEMATNQDVIDLVCQAHPVDACLMLNYGLIAEPNRLREIIDVIDKHACSNLILVISADPRCIHDAYKVIEDKLCISRAHVPVARIGGPETFNFVGTMRFIDSRTAVGYYEMDVESPFPCTIQLKLMKTPDETEASFYQKMGSLKGKVALCTSHIGGEYIFSTLDFEILEAESIKKEDALTS